MTIGRGIQQVATNVPTCHPERKYCARGLCGPCYQRAAKYGTLGVHPPKGRSRQIPTCHPDRRWGARGMCSTCYARWAYQNDPAHRERQQRSHRRFMEANPDTGLANEAARRLRRYGITQEQHDRLLAKQGWACAICRAAFDDQKPCIDHDHESSQVRGLLCPRCNLSLGGFKDNVDALKAAIEYLRRWSHRW